ncbi:MAG: amidohydrolase family protein, partial [Spirochaetaceae bacterium]|nr:amidohydrolase family protein [Spirochaetaceae bacterium]
CFTCLVQNSPKGISLSRLSALMSGNPARILGLGKDRGRIAAGFRADFCIARPGPSRPVGTRPFKSRGRNSPFLGRELGGSILMTIHGGHLVFDSPV